MVKNTANRIENFTPIADHGGGQAAPVLGEQAKYKTFAEVIAAVKAGQRSSSPAPRRRRGHLRAPVKELGFTPAQMAYITNDATSGAITAILGGHVDLVLSKPAAADQYSPPAS
jgi:putative tricarboxylic transport membrane protein